jgi:hypothetical protein
MERDTTGVVLRLLIQNIPYSLLWDGDNELDAEKPYKFIVKKKSSVICYVLDSIKMIEFLEKEGVITNNTGECLITSHLENGNDSDSD